MSKNRNLRQRKKLHVGEFKELGFNIEINLKEELSDQVADVLIADFINEIVEPRKLMYGGWLTFGFICRDSRGDASEEDRAAVRAWLEKRPEIAEVKVGELVDAWR